MKKFRSMCYRCHVIMLSWILNRTRTILFLKSDVINYVQYNMRVVSRSTLFYYCKSALIAGTLLQKREEHAANNLIPKRGCFVIVLSQSGRTSDRQT